MFETRFTKLVGIQYPIMQGGMQHIGTPELAAAVSNAGGLGTINVTVYPVVEDFRNAVRRVKELTSNPFAVNISLSPGVTPTDKIEKYIAICAEEKVRVIETSGNNPQAFVPAIKDAGILLIHKCPSVKHAKKAQSFGADAVTIVGYEAAGHPNMDELGTMILANRVAAELDIPVLAAGGIADGKGLAAALALGCEGVTMGTVFVASEECVIHPNFKEAIVAATEVDTTTCQRSIRNMTRYLKNDQTNRVAALEETKPTLEQMLQLVSGSLSKVCYENGDLQNCVFACGPAAGLIHEVKPVRQIIDDMMLDASRAVERVCKIAVN